MIDPNAIAASPPIVSNAVNLTDGIDGLAIGLGAFCFVAFAGLSYISGNRVFADYLNILYLEGSGELSIYCMAVVGACRS